MEYRGRKFFDGSLVCVNWTMVYVEHVEDFRFQEQYPPALSEIADASPEQDARLYRQDGESSDDDIIWVSEGFLKSWTTSTVDLNDDNLAPPLQDGGAADLRAWLQVLTREQSPAKLGGTYLDVGPGVTEDPEV